MNQLWRDISIGIRGFRRTPAFLLTAVTILAVGIGMSVAMFTVYHTVLARKLPVVEQDRVAVMWTYRDSPNIEYATSPKDLAVVQRNARTIRDVAGVMHGGATTVAMLDGDRSLALNRSLITGNFFDVRPALGRLLHASDDDTGPYAPTGTNAAKVKVMVLSYRAWQQKFGGDSSVPIWGGWTSQASTIAVARLAAGATLNAAADEYYAIENDAVPEPHFRGAMVRTFSETVLGDARPVIAMLTAAVGLLLLIACLNVGNLLLLRVTSRAPRIHGGASMRETSTSLRRWRTR